MAYTHRTDPKTKAQLLDRLLALDAEGHLRNLAEDQQLKIERDGDHAILLKFPTSGKTFRLSIEVPKSEKAIKALQASWKKRHGTTKRKPTGRTPPRRT